MKPSQMLYVHIPFCHAKCAYCDFYSTPQPRLMERFAEALAAEADERCTEGFSPDTIYIGGGTPSMLPPKLLGQTMRRLPAPADTMSEFTVEANPEDVTPEWTGLLLAETRANRVSMGIQSLDDGELEAIGRRHSAGQARKAVSTLREGGVDNLSLDLIYGLPGQSLDSWKRSLDGVLEMRPDHLSAYLLSYEPATRLGRLLERGLVEEASEALVGEMYGYLCQAARSAGYEHYEISNFALPGRRARHNSGYWDGTPYIGLGPGAHSWWGGRRGAVAPDLARYLRLGGRGVWQAEEETDAERYNDIIITSLRTSAGLKPGRIEREVGPGFRDHLAEAAAPLIDRGLLALGPDGAMAIPERHWLVSDSIFIDLIIA
ncbi:MAG: radical SAM family heme chaperone HemW [Duncaniella sp.]|nr:radical SAM family heme chaperone HemW [Duncaniella sp.]